MTKEDKVVFLKNPNHVLEQLIKNFVNEAQPNRRTQLDHGIYWEEPLVGFASGIDPLFFEYKTLIGPFHLTPREIISAALKERGRSLLFTEIEQISVISWALPVSEDTRMSNRQEKQFPSKLWAYTRDFGEACNVALRKHVMTFLEDLGHPAVAPTLSPSFQYLRDEKVGWASPWSERHIAYACGLGTFSLNDGLITPKGNGRSIRQCRHPAEIDTEREEISPPQRKLPSVSKRKMWKVHSEMSSRRDFGKRT